jgi:hypothetical protein
MKKRAIDLGTVDWVRLAHRALTFVRELRGDPDVAADAERLGAHGRKAREGLEQMGRSAIGCKAPAACVCGFCREQREEKPS